MRIGSISYINSLPVDMGLAEGKVSSCGAAIISGFPSDLNRKMLSGEVDLGPVSAFWYAEHSERFYILPDLSISSESGVRSVLLFSRFPIKDLAEKRIAVTNQGKTTPALLEIICRSFYGFTPQLEVLKPVSGDILAGADAALVIGDEALLMREKYRGTSMVVTDLAEEWKRHTGLSFVFAVWALRRDFFERFPEDARKALTALRESKRWGLSHLAEILNKAQSLTGLPEAVLKDYFSCLSYDFNEELQKGMRRFFEEARGCGLLSTAPVIEFMPVLAGHA